MQSDGQAREDWEQVAEEVAALSIGTTMDTPATPELPADQPQEGASLGSSEAVAPEALPEAMPVDHALRDALSHPKNRASVLKLEEEVEAFVLNTQETQYVFIRDMTSYERLLAHRTAQHWGLETTTISQGPDQGKIVAYRAAHTAVPKVRLSAVPVTMMADLPSAAASPASPAPAPRVLVRKRPDRLGPRGGGGPQGDMHGGGGGMMGGFPGGGGFRSVEERQQEYHRARARIFGGEGGVGGYPPPQQPPMHHRGPMFGAPVVPSSPVGVHQQPPFAMSPPRAVGIPPAGFGRPASGWGGMGGGSNGNGNGGRKAVLRNKHEDLNDPDFRRHRHSGPRFDPGFGEDEQAQQSMYIRPTYSSEFPELGGQSGGQPGGGRGGSRPGGPGSRGPDPRQSPRRGGPANGMQGGGAGGGPMGGPGGYPVQQYGGQVPPGTVMAMGPMGPYTMVPPGMMMAGPMPGMGGGMAMYSTGGTAVPFHPSAGGYYAAPMMPAYGYYSAGTSGQEAAAAAAAMQYAAAAAGPYGGFYPGMQGPGGGAAGMGGFPGGPAAAAAMAAMSAPGPAAMSPHAPGAQSPHQSMGRQRSGSARSRNSGGGHSSAGNAGSPAGTPRQQAQLQQAHAAEQAAAAVEAAQQAAAAAVEAQRQQHREEGQ